MPKDGGDKLVLERNEWNGTSRYPLSVMNDRWVWWQSRDGKWNSIRIPYDHQDRLKTTADVIVLAERGQVYLRSGDDSSDKGMRKLRMKYRDSSWCYYNSESNSDDKWESLDSLYDY